MPGLWESAQKSGLEECGRMCLPRSPRRFANNFKPQCQTLNSIREFSDCCVNPATGFASENIHPKPHPHTSPRPLRRRVQPSGLLACPARSPPPHRASPRAVPTYALGTRSAGGLNKKTPCAHVGTHTRGFLCVFSSGDKGQVLLGLTAANDGGPTTTWGLLVPPTPKQIA